jgi:hypothetical protein
MPLFQLERNYFYGLFRIEFIAPNGRLSTNKTWNVRVTERLGALGIFILDTSQIVIILNPLQLHFLLSFKICAYKTECSYCYTYYCLLLCLWEKSNYKRVGANKSLAWPTSQCHCCRGNLVGRIIYWIFFE